MLASILDSIAKGISLFPRFFAWCIPASIFIQLNDFCTCIFLAHKVGLAILSTDTAIFVKEYEMTLLAL